MCVSNILLCREHGLFELPALFCKISSTQDVIHDWVITLYWMCMSSTILWLTHDLVSLYVESMCPLHSYNSPIMDYDWVYISWYIVNVRRRQCTIYLILSWITHPYTGLCTIKTDLFISNYHGNLSTSLPCKRFLKPFMRWLQHIMWSSSTSWTGSG